MGHRFEFRKLSPRSLRSACSGRSTGADQRPAVAAASPCKHQCALGIRTPLLSHVQAQTAQMGNESRSCKSCAPSVWSVTLHVGYLAKMSGLHRGLNSQTASGQLSGAYLANLTALQGLTIVASGETGSGRLVRALHMVTLQAKAQFQLSTGLTLVPSPYWATKLTSLQTLGVTNANLPSLPDSWLQPGGFPSLRSLSIQNTSLEGEPISTHLHKNDLQVLAV